jgi:hypothetical protein
VNGSIGALLFRIMGILDEAEETRENRNLVYKYIVFMYKYVDYGKMAEWSKALDLSQT